MKKVCLILMLLVSGMSFGQDGVVVSRSLVEYLKEYIQTAKYYGYNVVPHISKMDSIVYSDRVQFPNVGLARKDGSQVLVNNAAKIEGLAARMILFHELSHAIFKLPHCKGCDSSDIMYPSAPKTFSVYADKDYWDKKVEELFLRIDKFVSKESK